MAESVQGSAAVKWFVRVNRRGIHLVRIEHSRANGKGVHVRSLVKWGKR